MPKPPGVRKLKNPLCSGKEYLHRIGVCLSGNLKTIVFLGVLGYLNAFDL